MNPKAICLAAILFAGSAAAGTSPMEISLVKALGDVGFFANLPDQSRASLTRNIQEHGYGGLFTHPWRSYRADDESLAEGGVADLIATLRPAFEALRIPAFTAQVDQDDDGAMHLLSEGKRTLLISAAEIARDESGKEDGLAWGLIGARLVRAINAHLRAAGVSDRFYSYLGGNDHWLLLLTPEMFSLLSNRTEIAARERPYERTDRWPNFGAPR